ncbi:MAG: hormogonium polysaccharide biosynthesis glycosyltransferase HpsE [Cyanobacteria bacterium P01_H01_bin.58]
MSESTNEPGLLDITVAIPTYNGASRLPQVLERLKAQTSAADIRWEILVVDNNSQDNTAEAVQQHQTQWPSAIPLRYCFESRQGAAFARQLAIREAQGALVGFLDDDNLPEPNWVAEAVAFSRQYPKAGAFSGRIYGAYETEPPEGFEKIKAFLAIRDHGPQVMSFAPLDLRLPPAASLIVRKQAWLESVPKEPTLTGKLPGLFIQGDDYEPMIYLHKANWEILYNPRLITHHQIPQQRFEKAYLLTLAKGCGLATYQLKCIRATPQEAMMVFMRTVGGNLRRLIMHGFKYRQRIWHELEPGMLWAFYWGSFLSPFVKIKRKSS